MRMMSAVLWLFTLELEPQRELNLAAVSAGNRIGDGPCRRANVIAARENNQIGVTKVRVIESVEDLRPKLQIHLLFQRNPFEQRRIHVPHTRSPQLVATGCLYSRPRA